jgi:hypothetical protein
MEEFTRWTGDFPSPSGSISMARQASLYMRPTNNNVESILPLLKMSSLKPFLARARFLLKDFMVWKDSGKKTSWLFQEAQGGKSSGIGEAFGWNYKMVNIENEFEKRRHTMAGTKSTISQNLGILQSVLRNAIRAELVATFPAGNSLTLELSRVSILFLLTGEPSSPSFFLFLEPPGFDSKSSKVRSWEKEINQS